VKLERLLGWPSEPHTVEDLHGRGYNFDPRRLRELIVEEDWHHDERSILLSLSPLSHHIATVALAQSLTRLGRLRT